MQSLEQGLNQIAAGGFSHLESLTGSPLGGDFKGPMRQVKAVELRSEPAH